MRATEFIVETAMMGKVADSGKIIRILKKAHTVSFSDEKNWLLVDTDPGKGNSGLGIKWIPADTRFEWVRPFHDNINESNVFTDARMNAIKAGKKVFKVHGKTYNVTGDITDELEASVNENLSPQTIHKLADRKGVKWDNEPSFLQLTKRLTGKEHLDDLDHSGLNKVKRHLDGLQGVAEGSLNEGLAHPVIVVDVQPEYSGMNDGDESSVFPQIINFVNKQTGPVLMFVNAEDQGLSGDTIPDIKQYWDDTICPEEERYTYDEETDDYSENSNCPRINWQRFAIADKGYGYFRSWMDHGIEPATIIATIRELYQQKKSDSRELQFPAFNRRTPQQSLIMGAMQEMEDDPISVNWTSVSQLKRFNGAYIVGGARDQCLREVELLMNAFNIKYKRIDSLIYEGQQGVAESVNRGGIDLEVTELPDDDQLLITATSHGKTLGRVYFDIFDTQLTAADAEVASEYRGQGIAAIIYDYVKELGWEVVRSGKQTANGAAFWDKHKPGKDIWEQGVAENFANGRNPQDKGDAKRHGVPTKASVSTLRKVAKQGGRKGQLAHWMANMKAGRAKKKTNEAEVATKNSDEIWQQLRAAGYQYVGSGADATVFAKDDSHVIKILMPEDMGTKAEQVFRKFYEFSMSHQDLACVPRFNEVNTIDINGKDYTQIEMERLSPIEKNSFIEGLIWFLSDYINTNTPWPTVESELVNPETWEIYSPNYANAFAKTWQSLLENPASKKTYAMYRQLYNVMKLLYTTGTINKFGWDLHAANVMLRQNGQPVIIDPWFSEGTS